MANKAKFQESEIDSFKKVANFASMESNLLNLRSTYHVSLLYSKIFGIGIAIGFAFLKE